MIDEIIYSFGRNSENVAGNGQQYSGNKPPLISGSPISGGKGSEDEKENNSFQEIHHPSAPENVNVFYRISAHLYSKLHQLLCLVTTINYFFEWKLWQKLGQNQFLMAHHHLSDVCGHQKLGAKILLNLDHIEYEKSAIKCHSIFCHKNWFDQK